MAHTDGKKSLHLVGVGVKHSIAPPMHNHIAESLGLPWTFHSTECPSLDDLMTLARSEETAGLVVTMPYKNTVMACLDRLDELATTIGACNNVNSGGCGRVRNEPPGWTARAPGKCCSELLKRALGSTSETGDGISCG